MLFDFDPKMTLRSQPLSLLVMMMVMMVVLVTMLPAVRPESAERGPFYGFLPKYKIRALSPLGDGHPNDIYHGAQPDPDPIPAGFEIRYPSYKFTFDVPQDPEEAAYIITARGVPSASAEDCHHQHHGDQSPEHHHGDGHREASATAQPSAATAAPTIHSMVRSSSYATMLPSRPPTTAEYGRTTLTAAFPTAPTGEYTGPTTTSTTAEQTVPTAASLKTPTRQSSGYVRPPSPPHHVNRLPHGRPAFGPPRPAFRPSRPPFGYPTRSLHPVRHPFAPPRAKFAPPRPQLAAGPASLVPGHTATPPPSRFGRLKSKRGQFPAEQYRVFPGGYARLSTYSKLSG